MDPIGFITSLVLLLPWYMALPPLLFFATLLVLHKFDIFIKVGLAKNRLSSKQLLVVFLSIVSMCIISGLLIAFHFSKKEKGFNKNILELQTLLSKCVHGSSTETLAKRDLEEPRVADCQNWDQCTDFKSDFGLDNKHYTHAHEDLQILILESGSWPSPPLYFDKETSPFYSFKLDATPLDSEAGNIVIISKDMFRLFIGDGDYRSLAFEKWNHRISDWERKEESKIYLGRDLKSADIEPKTQFNITVETKKKAGKVEVTFSLAYKPSDAKKEKETVKFVREISLPAAEPEKILTKVGTGMYRSKGDIQQAKFYFMGLKEK